VDEKTDFVNKLRQIEEQAYMANAELPASLARTCIQHIIVLAKMLRGRLEFGAVTITSTSGGLGAAPPGDEEKPSA
jgi:hypothetical protein